MRAQHLGRLLGTRKLIGRTTRAHALLLDPPQLSLPHTAEQLMAPVGALKQRKSGSSEAVSIVYGLQMLTMQREAASEQRESVRMVSEIAAKEHMDKYIYPANKKIELEQRRLEQDEKDRAVSRSMRRDEHMLSIVVALNNAGQHMDDFVA